MGKADCPDDAELVRFLDGRLTHTRIRALEDHFDVCQPCRELAFVLASLDPHKIRRAAR